MKGPGARRRRPARRCSPTTGSTSRSPTCGSAGLQIFNNWSPGAGRRPDQGLAGARVLLQRGRRAVAHDRRRDSRRSAIRELAKIDLIDAADVVDGDRDPRAQGLSGLLRRVCAVRRDPRRSSTRFATSSWSAATACTATTTRITRCSPRRMAVDNIAAGSLRQEQHLGRQRRRRVPRGTRRGRRLSACAHFRLSARSPRRPLPDDGSCGDVRSMCGLAQPALIDAASQQASRRHGMLPRCNVVVVDPPRPRAQNPLRRSRDPAGVPSAAGDAAFVAPVSFATRLP